MSTIKTILALVGAYYVYKIVQKNMYDKAAKQAQEDVMAPKAKPFYPGY